MPLVWMLVGASITLLAVYGNRLVKKGLKWFDWVWLLVVALLAFTTISFVLVSFEEAEVTAAWRGLMLFGLPTLLLTVPMIRRWIRLA